VLSASLVLEDLAAGNFRLTRHAIVRMGQRTVTRADICSVCHTGVAKLADGDKVEVTGFDLDGDELTVVCVCDEGTLIITVF
jgi:DNA-binding IclR family transcriptional regulator